MAQRLVVQDLTTYFYMPQGTVIKAVDGVSLRVNRGETCAIVGESGSGKSVFCRSMLGLINEPGRIIRGSVLLDGNNLLSLDEKHLEQIRGRKIGLVLQEPMAALNPLLTIGYQLMEPMRVHLGLSRSEARTRAVELLAEVQISDPSSRLRQYPVHLSGGMRQRVMIAIALSCEPDVLIADEPTTALDVTVQAQILDMLDLIRERRDLAVILVTHNLGLVAQHADYIYVMYAGRIVEHGPTADVFASPSHPYTVDLLRSVPRIDMPKGTLLEPIRGNPPDLARLPRGCSYRERCDFAVDICGEIAPGLVNVQADCSVACYQWAQVRLLAAGQNEPPSSSTQGVS